MHDLQVRRATCAVSVWGSAAGMVVDSMAESDVRELMSSLLIGVGSDNAVPGPGLPHPRTLGTYPRLLGRHVRELEVLTLEEAIRKSTSLVAARFGLFGRSTLLQDSYADGVFTGGRHGRVLRRRDP